jgi:hypothetical protein
MLDTWLDTKKREGGKKQEERKNGAEFLKAQNRTWGERHEIWQ